MKSSKGNSHHGSDGKALRVENLQWAETTDRVATVPPPGAHPDIAAEDWRDPECFGSEEPVDPSHEFSADLSPEAKARLLREMATARKLPFRERRDAPAAAAFFEANPQWAAGHILSLMERCARLEPRKNGKDLLWHAKGGAEFAFLVVNIAKILQQLRVQEKYPPACVLPRGNLYTPRRTKPRRGRRK